MTGDRPASSPTTEGGPAMAHNGQHDNCGQCGNQRRDCPNCRTTQPVTLGGTLARHDQAGNLGVTGLGDGCPGSGAR